jgi:hypothetical protein
MEEKMFKANIIEALITSPADVIQERKIVQEIIDEWNIINSKKQSVMIKALSWERDVYSSMKDGSGQESINKQILEETDVLIGIFWTRIGTPTGTYISGSVEEIEKHINANKPTMLYFSNVPVQYDSVDQVQFSKLVDFKKKCLSKGLVSEFSSPGEFIELLRKQLGLLMNNDPYICQITNRTGESAQAAYEIPRETTLSQDAKELLKEISLDPSGIIMTVLMMDGFIVQTNGKNFGSDHYDVRQIAQINSILEELEENDLIRANNAKRESFTITAKGFKIADSTMIDVK